MKMRKSSDQWFLFGKNSDAFYSPTPKKKRSLFFVGDGSKSPTPKELYDHLMNLQAENETNNVESFSESNHVYSYDTHDITATVELPGGTYFYQPDNYPIPERLIPVTFRADEYIKLPRITNLLVEDIRDFIKSEPLYRKLNIIYKMGLMLYGPPGEGKTSLVRAMVRDELPQDAVVIVINESIPSVNFLKSLKNTLPDRLKVFILEEFTHFTKDTFDMEEVLTFTDGENSLDRSIIIATTNYPEILPGNIVQRPSRFDKLYKISSPDAEERKLLLTHYLMREPSAEEVALSKGMSSAAIKEISLLTHKKNLTLTQAIVQLKKQLNLAKSEFKEGGQFGLGNDDG